MRTIASAELKGLAEIKGGAVQSFKRLDRTMIKAAINVPTVVAKVATMTSKDEIEVILSMPNKKAFAR
jgi:hypothetical protein